MNMSNAYKKIDTEMETAELFASCNRLRGVEKCCATCKHGEHGWEGEISCNHPELTYVDEDGCQSKADLGIRIAPYTICDLWQDRKK